MASFLRHHVNAYWSRVYRTDLRLSIGLALPLSLELQYQPFLFDSREGTDQFVSHALRLLHSFGPFRPIPPPPPDSPLLAVIRAEEDAGAAAAATESYRAERVGVAPKYKKRKPLAVLRWGTRTRNDHVRSFLASLHDDTRGA